MAELVPDHTDPEQLRDAYERHDGNISAAAEEFPGVGYRAVYNRMVEHGIHEPERQPDRRDLGSLLEAADPDLLDGS